MWPAAQAEARRAQDRFPAVIAEVRGEGLLVGLRAAVPNGELVDELRAEKLNHGCGWRQRGAAVAPLIVSDAEIAEAVHRLSGPAAGSRSSMRAMELSMGLSMEPSDEHQWRPSLYRSVRHQHEGFARHDDASRAMKERLKRGGQPGKAPLKGKTLAMIFDGRRRARASPSTSPCASSAGSRSR